MNVKQSHQTCRNHPNWEKGSGWKLHPTATTPGSSCECPT